MQPNCAILERLIRPVANLVIHNAIAPVLQRRNRFGVGRMVKGVKPGGNSNQHNARQRQTHQFMDGGEGNCRLFRVG